IRQDLNAPAAAIQAVLAAAEADGDIRVPELVLSTPEGSTPLEGWLWARGFLAVADDPEYGPYLTLSDKGRRFIQADVSGWFNAEAGGTPRMQCQAGASVTSADCDAVVTYSTVAGREAGMANAAIPQSRAYLEAAFRPGEGWSVTRLSAEGDTPSAAVRKALFGSSDDQQAGRDAFVQAVRARLETMNAANAEAQVAPASAAASAVMAAADQAAAAPKPPVARASNPGPAARPSTVINASYARRPTQDELLSVYPRQALSRGLTGRSSMTCMATVSGTLEDCVSESETPIGSRFGQAAVSAAPFFRMNPRTENGQPVESSVSLSIVWQP
ncbi:MAG TPA: energy transducer TonB, partial [Brevundimonas sp.]|nr:energy transducer TonB [Brevundimonas sp.]